MQSKRPRNTIGIPSLLLPKKNVDLSKWAVVACDQFTSQPNYWKELSNYIGNAPSTLRMVLPEVYLEKMNDLMIDEINQKMNDYLNQNVLEDLGPTLLLIERTTAQNNKRLGLMVSIDLEDYEYQEGKKPLIRTTEKTIVSRIPPRERIRKQAPLELSHVMLLMDDKKHQIIEKLYDRRHDFEKIYDFPLNMLGGHLRGYKVTNEQKVIGDLYQLIDDSNDEILFVAGDGNHSLATAKSHWEHLKQTLSQDEIETHPARHALVEIINIYDQGLHFEGIHRVLFNVSNSFLTDLFHNVDKEEETWVYTKENGKTPFFIPKSTALAYEQIQTFIDKYITQHPEVAIDYIHGDLELTQVCDEHKNSIGIRMPALAKEDLFPFIKMGKILPRKSFSMGEATSKRYYLESRYIIKK